MPSSKFCKVCGSFVDKYIYTSIRTGAGKYAVPVKICGICGTMYVTEKGLEELTFGDKE